MCSRCATSFIRVPTRLYSATTVTSSQTSPPPSEDIVPPSPTRAPPPYDVRSGLILTRPPLLTRKLHSFENAFFFYQKRLEERLNTPFITSIYFKPDTARRLDWNLKVQERKGTVAKEIGVYNGKSSKAWDDELKVGDDLSSQESVLECLLKDAEARVSDDAEVISPEDRVPVERPMERETEADKKGDVRRLDRQLDKTLYLVVKNEDGWGFPADVIAKDENLHEVSVSLCRLCVLFLSFFRLLLICKCFIFTPFLVFFLFAPPTRHIKTTTCDSNQRNNIDRQTSLGPSRRRQHEYLDRRPRPRRARRQAAPSRPRRIHHRKRPKDLFSQGSNHGRPG